MAIYQKRPETVFAQLFIPEAIKGGVFQMDGGWGSVHQFPVFKDSEGATHLKFTEGGRELRASIGDYVVIDHLGKRSVMTAAQFHGTFVRVEN